MRLSRCSRPSGPLERAPLTELWASVAGPSGAAVLIPAAASGALASAAAESGCEAWWTADERYVLRVDAVGGELWYVGELDAAADAATVAAGSDGADVAGAPTTAAPRPPREVAPACTRTMLVGRQRGRRSAPPAMRLHVRRPPRP